MSRPRKRRGVRVGIAVVALAIVVAAGVLAARSFGGQGTGSGATAASGPTATTTVPSPVLNVDGSVATPTAEPPSVATDPPNTATAPPTTGRAPRSVSVVLTYADWDPGTGVSAAGYVADTVEQGGTCTLTLTRGGKSVEVTTEGIADASNTACGALTVAPAQLSTGTWTSVLTYSSTTSTGTSQSVQVKVP